MRQQAPVSDVVGNTCDMRVDQTLDRDAERRRLEAGGYRNVAQVFDPGDFAGRGALLDVYPMGADLLFRVELFDDVIATMRGSDPETQRPLDRDDAVQLVPGPEVPVVAATVTTAKAELRQPAHTATRPTLLLQHPTAATP